MTRTPPAPIPPPPFWRTPYFANDVMQRRPYLQHLTQGDIDRILRNPIRRKRQQNGRTQYWGYVESLETVIRLVMEPDGITVMNAFKDP